MKNLLVLPVVFLSILAGCAQEASSSNDASESDVVGVTDFPELEAAWGLVKDVKVNGAYTRTDAVLKNGGCYLSRMGAGVPDRESWEFRRYTKATAFFRKVNTGPATGDQRPVACIDVSTDEGDTVALEGIGLDIALRNRLGRPTGTDGAMGHTYFDFAGTGGSYASIEVIDADHWCGNYDPSDDFEQCKIDFAASTATSTIDTPAFDGIRVSGTSDPYLDPSQAAMAYAYANAKGRETDRFSMDTDPVGHFIKAEGAWDGNSIARYEHLDIHQVTANGTTALYVTPKGSDNTAAASAIASCVATDGPYVCKGL